MYYHIMVHISTLVSCRRS